eukprot:gene10211-11260_t
MSSLERRKGFGKKACASIVAAKPNSADVERFISTYTCPKTWATLESFNS